MWSTTIILTIKGCRTTVKIFMLPKNKNRLLEWFKSVIKIIKRLFNKSQTVISIIDKVQLFTCCCTNILLSDVMFLQIFVLIKGGGDSVRSKVQKGKWSTNDNIVGRCEKRNKWIIYIFIRFTTKQRNGLVLIWFVY